MILYLVVLRLVAGLRVPGSGFDVLASRNYGACPNLGRTRVYGRMLAQSWLFFWKLGRRDDSPLHNLQRGPLW